MAQSLKEIFDNLERHCGKHSHYFDVYEQHFSRFRGKKPVVVEVGICRGGSAEMWQKYFGEDATIIGIDIDTNAFKPEHQTPGCEQIQGDASDPKFWEEFFETHPNIDVFIDDGGHHMTQQISTLQCVWDYINLDGVYLCEDTHTSYWPEYSGGLERKDTFMEFSKKIIDTMNCQYYKGNDVNQTSMGMAEAFGGVVGMHFYDSIVVLDKNEKPKSELVTSTPI